MEEEQQQKKKKGFKTFIPNRLLFQQTKNGLLTICWSPLGHAQTEFSLWHSLESVLMLRE